MSGSAFPGLVGFVVGEPDPFATDGSYRSLGMVVGWEDGYLVLVTGNGAITRTSSTRQGLKVLGKGEFSYRGDGEEGEEESDDEDALPPGSPERAVA